jgi:hypothetical protein
MQNAAVKFEGGINRVTVVNTGNPSSVQGASATQFSPISQSGRTAGAEPVHNGQSNQEV